MKRRLNMIVDELRRLKREGVSVIHVAETTLPDLRERTRHLRAAPPSSEISAPVAPRETRARVKELLGESGPLPDFNPTSGTAKKPKKAARKLPNAPKVELPAGDKTTQWEALRQQVLECPTCNATLRPEGRVIFGTGNLDADIFFIGNAPGQEEEESGEPFAGDSGGLLTKMLQAMGLKREDVYLTEIMNWRPDTPTPTGKRPPTPEELAFCLPYLVAQIEIIRPQVIVALGNQAIIGLFGTDFKGKVRDLRGTWKEFRGTPVLISFHPAYLLNSTNQVKRTGWEDLLQVMEKIGMEISNRQRGFFLPKQ